MRYKSVCDVQAFLFRKKMITKREIYDFWQLDKNKKNSEEAYKYLKQLFK